ncbi:unnamed protein product [Allacma fusca]|uniref:Uncharacterized protein n=1 Tax=Allacma fusca TaxID=39272 RepID=A0A8J2JBY1_9HEXA|nr:unnamed protein product [Allacma fusca]
MVKPGLSFNSSEIFTAFFLLCTKKMRLSFTILVCHLFILLLLALSIAMEIPAWLNDYNWNQMQNETGKRFRYEELVKCSRALMNGSVQTPAQADYNRIFEAHKRDLPFETYFLGLCASSFLMYLICSLIYLGWKRILPNIYISMVANFTGILIHCGAFALILTSTVIYSQEHRHYMGAKACYNFRCQNCPDDEDYQERTKHLHYNARNCLEKLSVCQSNWLKDRIVYLLLGCILASVIAFGSSLSRRRRHSKLDQNPLKKMSIDSEDLVLLRPSMKAANEKSSLSDTTVINSLLAEGSDK